jgi:hypothetical protein
MPSTFHESETGQAVIENTTLIGSELKVNWGELLPTFYGGRFSKVRPALGIKEPRQVTYSLLSFSLSMAV